MKVTVRKGNFIHVFDGATSVDIEGDDKSGVAQRSEQAPYKSPTMGSSPTARTKPTAPAKLGGSGREPDEAAEAARRQPTSAAVGKRGRPRIHEDRKAYNAQKQREYRARKKEKPNAEN